jgi:hypothetical protein
VGVRIEQRIGLLGVLALVEIELDLLDRKLELLYQGTNRPAGIRDRENIRQPGSMSRAVTSRRS